MKCQAMRIKILALAAVSLMACQSPSPAETRSSSPASTKIALSDADMRCFLASSTLIQREQTREAGTMASLYFMGKLMASAPSEAELEAHARRVTPTLTDTSVELRRCGAEMQTSGAMTTRIGSRMTADGT